MTQEWGLRGGGTDAPWVQYFCELFEATFGRRSGDVEQFREACQTAGYDATACLEYHRISIGVRSIVASCPVLAFVVSAIALSSAKSSGK